MAILGQGQRFGEEDVVNERPYTSTVFCRSDTAVVFCIKKEEFFRKLKQNADCWSVILKHASCKERGI